MSLISVEEAQARLLSLAEVLPAEEVDLLSARGRYLAQPIAALRDQPWADLSAMDGYAIRHADLPGPWRLIGESRAGGALPPVAVQQGEAMRIFTGAPMPEGADCVLIQEEAAAEGSDILLCGNGPEYPGKNLRMGASDFSTGIPLIDAGCCITPAYLALAAMAGHHRVAVRRKPRVAIIATGDELAVIGEPLKPGQIPASNSVMLTALLAEGGAEVVDLGLFPDDLESIAKAFRSAADADIIVSTGGASVGDHDLVAPAILAAGGTLDFWKIAMRPGKPLMAGSLGTACVIGLPGNPVSAYVGALLFLLPLVRKFSGAASPLPKWTEYPVAVPFPKGGARSEYLRATLADGVVTAFNSRDSAALRALALSNVLVERAAGASEVQPGDMVRVLHL